MGAVWRAQDTVLGRAVALKRLGGIGTAEGPDHERARREAMLAARLNHPHIVAVYDLVVDDEGWSWLVMEHVPGITLSHAITQGTLQTEAVARIGRQVGEALAAAHAAGIAHRDVKPSNILLTQEGTAKLSDFGIARGENDDALTRTGQVTGSPAYLPPEVARGANGGPAGDMWSLGATLFHAASGRAPYSGEGTAVSTLFRIVQDPVPQLEGHGALSSVVARLMTPEPEGRPDAVGVAAALAVIAGDTQSNATQAVTPLAMDTPGDADPDATMPVDATEAMTATSAMAPVPPAPVPAPEPVGPPRADEDRRSKRPWLIAAAAALVVVLIAAFAITRGGDGDDTTAAPEPLTAQELDTFGRDFVQTASADPDEAFELLTPEAQDAVGGIEAFRDSWAPAEGATPTEVAPDAAAETVAVTYQYTVTTQRSSSTSTTSPTPTGSPSPQDDGEGNDDDGNGNGNGNGEGQDDKDKDKDKDDDKDEEKDREEPRPEPEPTSVTENVTRTVVLHVVRDGDRLKADRYTLT